MSTFSPATQSWFDASFTGPTDIQSRGWAAIAQRQHCLLVAPTGSGKTLAAFLAAIDRCSQLTADAEPGVRVLYVSPLKALVYDVERNLRAPLAGIEHAAAELDTPHRAISVAIRTGDTPQKERQRQLRQPGDILVTTPESLYLLLGSRARQHFHCVHTVIIDEVHALAPTKRGAHLALSLERLSLLTTEEPQRIGLSATVRPLELVAKFLGGDRDVAIVDASAKPNLDLEVVVPVPNMERPPSDASKPKSRNLGIGQQEQGIWPAIYPELLDAIRAGQSTIIFVNSRGLCERLAQRLNELAEEVLVCAHHGSVSHDKRTEMEEGLKAGRIRGIVATSSLELGIDMGAVDRVLLVESPRSVARGLQRVGRAGHQVGAVSIGRVYPKFRGDLLEAAVIAGRMLAGEIEALDVPENPLDVLAQQVTAMCCDHDRTVDEIAQIVRRTHTYRTLTDGALEAVLDMVSGRYPSSDFADLRPLLSWDRTANRLSARRGTATITHMNAGTIPDRGAYSVHLVGGGSRLGELDEEMVYETRVGDNITLGATTWRVEEVNRNQVMVSPAPGLPGRLPFWKGDGPGRPIELGRAMGAFVHEVAKRAEKAAQWYVRTTTPLDALAAQNLVAYIHEQKKHTGAVPTHERVTIERFRDELGDWRVCILTPFGSRVHAPWAMAIQRQLSARAGFEVQVMYTDDGIVLQFADGEAQPDIDALVPSPDEVEDLLTEQLGDTALFAGLFRENAVRALLMTRRRPDQRTPLWVQRVKSQNLLATVRQFSTFPIVLETYRHALKDVFDLPGLTAVLRDIRSRRTGVDDVETASASPFARSLVFAYVAAYIYEQDAPVAERRAHALSLDRQLLGELLGHAELRELLDLGVIAQVEAELQCLSEHRRARDTDEVHDVLRRVGHLTLDELAARCEKEPSEWLRNLHGEQRALPIALDRSDDEFWIAAEDAGRYRDALGVAVPDTLPESFLVETDEPLEELVRRFARTHGPFLGADIAQHFRQPAERLEATLTKLLDAGVMVLGEIQPGGTTPEWCDAEVLRRIKRQTLARLRGEVAPVDDATLGRFLPEWHGISASGSRTRSRKGADGLHETVLQLEGVPFSFVELTTAILPARVTNFSLEMLDLLAATGGVVWIGHGTAGARDGRIALYRREQVAKLFNPDSVTPLGESTDLHDVVLTVLSDRGALFQYELQRAVQQERPLTTEREFSDTLWELVWSGRVTNDTFGPLQTFGWLPSRRTGKRRGPAVTAGRWTTVASLLDVSVTDTERGLAAAESLLERYGVASREAAQADSLVGGFTSVYRVLQAMEDAGKVRRGYFIEGMSGAQFARAGVIDRLRALRSRQDDSATAVLFLPASDPANPYGTLIPWPATGNDDATRPRRATGCWVGLVHGRPALFVGPKGRQMATFPGDDHAILLALRRVHSLPRPSGKGRMTIESIDRHPVAESPFAETLIENGFERTYRGLAAT